MKFRRPHRLLKLGALILIGILVGLVVSSIRSTKAVLAEIPLPQSAQRLVESYSVLGLRREVSFLLDEEYPSHSVRSFYAEWAQRMGWKLVPEDEDAWSTDRWQSFIDASGETQAVVDQWLVRWQSADASWDLRLAMRYERPRSAPQRPSEQTVYLAISRLGP